MPGKKRRLFILGAGASYAAGLPDAARAMGHFLLYVMGPILPSPNRTPFALFGNLSDALIFYAKEAGFRKGDRFPFESMAEAFYKAVQQHATGSAEQLPAAIELLSQFFIAVREYLYERSCHCAEGYAAFADSLRPGDIVITLNWDVCLEIALFLESKPATVSFRSVRDDGITIMKPHGSVDFCATEISKKELRETSYLELVHQSLPLAVAMGRLFAPQLVRIRTYDCPYEVQLSCDIEARQLHLEIDERKRPFVPLESDIGPLHLEKLLRDPSAFLLTPGAPRALYEWSYSQLVHMLEPSLAQVGTVIVCGYSFPDYDRTFVDALADIMRTIGTIPAHIVDPSASHLPQATLEKLFGTYELHERGFTDFNWAAL
jgi:hypothetical protein